MVEHPPFKRGAVSSSLTGRTFCPLRLSVRTSDFQSEKRSSILLEGVSLLIYPFPSETGFFYAFTRTLFEQNEQNEQNLVYS